MIVPMKKVTVIVQAKDREVLLEKLSNLGLLHIEHIRVPSGRDLNLIKEEIEQIEEARRILNLFTPAGKTPQREVKELKDRKNFILHIIDSGKRIRDLEDYRDNLEKDIGYWEEWGNFDPQIIKELQAENIYVKLYQIPLRELKHLPEEIIVKKISSKGGLVNCLVIAYGETNLSFREVTPPKMSLEGMRRRWEETKMLISSLEKELKEKAGFLQLLEKIKQDLEKEKEFSEAIKGMGELETLSYLRGYIPRESIEYFLQIARKEAWGVLVEDPSPEDRVPTLLRNPRWVEILSPLFRILEIFPGYHELDISLWFLIFLSLFFGILIGDAGYGFIYILLSFGIKKKWGHKIKEKSFFSLLYLLSFSAIIWGVLSGAIFGQEWLPSLVKPLIPALRNERTLQSFCFFLGAVHLSIAHLWKFMLKLPHFSSLAELGWISILWGAYFLARMLILGEAFPEFGKIIFLFGFILILFFTHPQKNIIKGLGKGMSMFLLNLVNNFTDVVSYIRLFAVGLATVAIADSFNKMAMDLGYKGFLSGLCTSLILISGHTLNILLGPMSVLVHGVRLNLLEFSNHLEVKWSGFLYRPLRK